MADRKWILPGTGQRVALLLKDNGDGTYSLGVSGGGGGGGGGAATIADGADVAQGARADAAYTSGSGTIVSILKGIFGKANTIDSTQGTISDAAWDGSASSATLMSYIRRLTATGGTTADSAWTSGTGSLIALLKSIAGGVGQIGDAAWSSGNGTLVSILKAISGSNTTIASAVATSRLNTRLQRDGVATALTIASAGTDTGAWDISGWIAGGFVIPSAFTGTAVSFKASQTSSGHQPLYDSTGTLISIPVAANRSYPLPPEAAGFNSIIISSNGAEGAARTINTWKKG